MDLKLNELPNIVTESDKLLIEKISFSQSEALSLYDKNGEAFELSRGQLTQEERLTLKGKNLVIVDLPMEIDDEEDLEQSKIYSKENPLKNTLVHGGSGYYSYKVVSLDDYSVIPRGRLFEQYKSELAVSPLVTDGDFNFGCKVVAEHLAQKLGIEDKDNHGYDLTHFVGKYLVCHPETGTYAYFDPDTLKYEVDYQRETITCESLDLAMALPFDWAQVECGYS